MIYSGAKMIEIPINRIGRNYFPDVQDLYGRKIQTITLYQHAIPLSDTGAYIEASDVEAWSINLTANGSTYEFLNVPATEFLIDNTLGKPIEIGHQLLLENCYIDAQTLTKSGKLIAVVWFETDDQYKVKATTDLSDYNSFDIYVSLGAGYRNYFPDNRDMAGKHFRGFNYNSEMTTTPYGTTAADLLGAATYISFIKGTYAIMERVPLVHFQQMDWIQRQKFDNIIFDFENSYLETADLNAAGAVNITCEFER